MRAVRRSCAGCEPGLPVQARPYQPHGPGIDDFVRKVIAQRLAEPDALRTVSATDSPRLAGLLAEIDEHRAPHQAGRKRVR